MYNFPLSCPRFGGGSVRGWVKSTAHPPQRWIQCAKQEIGAVNGKRNETSGCETRKCPEFPVSTTVQWYLEGPFLVNRAVREDETCSE